MRIEGLENKRIESEKLKLSNWRGPFIPVRLIVLLRTISRLLTQPSITTMEWTHLETDQPANSNAAGDDRQWDPGTPRRSQRHFCLADPEEMPLGDHPSRRRRGEGFPPPPESKRRRALQVG